MGPPTRLLDDALGLAWSLWAELGVSGWDRSHTNWSVELEPLIAYTAFLVEHDRRLLRETISWCVDNADLISMHQLRHVVTPQRWPFQDEIGRFGATVSLRSRRTWPASGTARPYEVEPSGKSRLGELLTPSMVQLRLRLLFGVSARAEIVRVLVSAPRSAWLLPDLASRVPYTRRQIANDLEALQLGGLVRRTERHGTAAYQLRSAEALLEVVGERPEITPRWAPLFRVLTTSLDASERLSDGRAQMPEAELARVLRHARPAIDASGLQEPPMRQRGSDVPAFLEWAQELFSSLGAGDPSFLLPETSHTPP